MVIDVQQAQPALLAQRQADRAAEFDQFGFAEVLVHACPVGVVGIQTPDDGFGVGERGLLPFVVFDRFFKVDQVVVMRFLQTLFGALDRALVTAELADYRA